MNIYDLGCIIILLTFAFFGAYRGLIHSFLGIGSTIISMAVSYALFPNMVRILRTFGVYTIIKQTIADTMNLQGIADDAVRQLQNQLIRSLPQSTFILGHLQANNNPEAYSILNVSSISDYIAGFFANMIVNLIAVVLVFIATRILLSIILRFLDLVADLPVIRQMNKTGGAIFGMIQGLLFVWLILCVLTFFFLTNRFEDMFIGIQSGLITGFLYNSNPIMAILVMLIP